MVSQGDYALDTGMQKLTEGQGLEWLFQSNVDMAGAILGRIDQAKVNVQQSVDDLEHNYQKLSEELQKKVEKQHQEQLEKLKADQVCLSGWIS